MADTPEPAKIDEDIRLVSGGSFTPDALGPERYERVRRRLQSHPDAYLEHFRRLFLGQNFDALLQSRLYLPTLLELLQEVAPAAAAQVATELLRQYDAVLVVYDATPEKQALFQLMPEETVRLLQRLSERRADLRPLTQSA